MSKLFTELAVSVMILAVSVSALSINSFATDVTDESSAIIENIVIDPIEPETEKPTEKETTKKETTKKETTKKETTKKVVATEADDDDNDYEVDDRDVENEVEAVVDVEKTTEKTGFKVYIELNNGEKRLQFDLTENSTVPKPTKTPTRKGFTFVGYYADENFTKKWDFSKDIAEKGTVIYVKWKANEDTELKKVTISPLIGGKIEVNPEKAVAGERINITIIPDDGKRMKSGSLKINGVATEYFTFVMPAEDVVITAEFEDIPQTETENESKIPLAVIAFGIGIIAAAIFVLAIILVRRRRMILDDDDEFSDWVDDTIVVQEGFKDGKVVKDNENEFVQLDKDQFITLDDDDLK